MNDPPRAIWRQDTGRRRHHADRGRRRRFGRQCRAPQWSRTPCPRGGLLGAYL